MASLTDHCTLYIDAPCSAIAERGAGGNFAGPNGWTYTDVFTVADGRGWCLAPRQYRTDWHTTAPSATPACELRHTLATDYTQSALLAPAADWTEVLVNGAYDRWQLSNVDNATLTTTGTSWTSGADGKLQANPHIILDVYMMAPLITNVVLLTVEFGDLITYDGSDSYRWKLTLDGLGNGVLYEFVETATDVWEYLQRAGGHLAQGELPHVPFRLYIAPLFRRSVFVFGTGDTWLEWADPDRDDGTDYASPFATSPLIPSGTVKVTATNKCQIQITEAAFPATGTLSAVAQLDYAPADFDATAVATTNGSGESLHWMDQPTGTSVAVTTAAYGTGGDAFTLTATLTPDSTYRITPTMYAVGWRIPPTTEDRPEVLGLTELIGQGNALSGLRLTVSAQGSSLEMPLTISDENALTLPYKLARAVILKCGTDEIFRGYAMDPERSEWDALNRVTFTCVDEWEDLAGTILPATENMDGYLVSDAIKAVLEYCGVASTRYYVTTTAARTASRGSNQTGDTGGFLQADGMTPAADFLRTLQSTYLNWHMDFAPVSGVVKFRFFPPWAGSVAATLYLTHAAAVAAGATIKSVVQKWSQRVLKPECNDLLVVGQAPGGNPLYAWYRDEVSMDPRITEANRPPNWLGRRRLMIIADSSLCTQAQVNAVCGWMAWLTKARLVVTCDCEWQPPVRYGDFMVVNGAVYYVDGYSMTIEQDSATYGIHRPATYSLWRYL